MAVGQTFRPTHRVPWVDDCYQAPTGGRIVENSRTVRVEARCSGWEGRPRGVDLAPLDHPDTASPSSVRTRRPVWNACPSDDPKRLASFDLSWHHTWRWKAFRSSPIRSRRWTRPATRRWRPTPM